MKKSVLVIIAIIVFTSCKSKLKIVETQKTQVKSISFWVKPPNLKKGDTVALLTPASFLKDSTNSVVNAIDSLKSWGLNYKLSKHIFDINGHFAGTDVDRAKDFQEAIDNPNIKAIWCTRGGYGSVRMIDMVDFSKLQKDPKWVIGYSDITAIHNEIHNNGVQSIHGVMPVNFKDTTQNVVKAINSLKNVFFGKKNIYTVESSSYNKKGKAKGVIVGGNLTILHTMLGSKSNLDMKGKILFIEDVGEKHYRVDRMLYSLKRAGYFENCKGLIVGSFTGAKKANPPFAKNTEELILAVLKEYNFPILFNFPAGHRTDNRAIVLGATVSLDVKNKTSKVEFE